MVQKIELISTAPVISVAELKKLGAIPAIRGYVKGWYPDYKGNGIGDLEYRRKGPIDLLDEIKLIDVYEKPKGKLVGYVQLPDGTFVGIFKERVNKKALVLAGLTVTTVAVAAIVIAKMDEDDKEEIKAEIHKEMKKIRKQLQKAQ